MKTIKTLAVITGVRSKVDKSLGVTVGTPELSPKEKALFMEIQGVNCEMTIKPVDEPNAEQVKVNKDLDQKPQSQRIRNVLYILWKQNSEDHEEFSTYYRAKTDKIIEHYKTLIED